MTTPDPASAAPDAFFDAAFARCPVMVILRGRSVEETVELCHRAWELGVALVEVPIPDAAAVDALRAAVAAGRAQGRPVGAGTVRTPAQVRIAAEAGAAFTVSPDWVDSVAEAAGEAGLPHLPGVATATEVGRATDRGHRWLKAFPASALGTAWFSAMSGPFPHARFVAVGGVGPDNAAEFLTAGARAVGAGGALRRDGALRRLVVAAAGRPRETSGEEHR